MEGDFVIRQVSPGALSVEAFWQVVAAVLVANILFGALAFAIWHARRADRALGEGASFNMPLRYYLLLIAPMGAVVYGVSTLQ